MMKKRILSLACTAAVTMTAVAQLSTNPDKFLGNITTRGQVNGTGFEYADLWNQITPENESKWQSVEGTRDRYNWTGCDNAWNYAKDHGFPFKFHTLVWGSQYPTWMDNLSRQDQYDEIVEWMDAIQQRYPDLEMIDVVNEAIPGHAPAPFKEALGGDGKTGYDWIVRAFEMAAERWPNAILIYNDYNTFQWQKSEFIDLVRRLRNAGAPIDAYGCQSHDLTDMNFTDFKKSMKEIQDALQMPMYSTEYDIATTDDQKQLNQYKDQIKYMWEQDYVAGITLWGFIYGATWTTDGNSGIIRNGKDRPAMTWLREYMASDEAQTARSPFPGMKKEASVYIKPATFNSTVDEPTTLTVNARLRTKMIEKVDLYAADQLIATLTEAPYTAAYTPTKTGEIRLRAVVTDTEGTTYERISGMNVVSPRKPYTGDPIVLPGTIEAENFDQGAEGIAFHDSNTTREGDAASYRTDTGIDIVKAGSGYAVGYTNTGEWMEYTVDVTKAGWYDFGLVASSGQEGGLISAALSTEEGLVPLFTDMAVPVEDWNTYRTLHGRCAVELQEGVQVIRITVSHTGVNIDKLKMSHIELNEDLQVALTAEPSPAVIDEPIELMADVTGGEVEKVTFYVNSQLVKTVEQAPYVTEYKAKAKGTYTIEAVATDKDGRVSDVARMELLVTKKRSPYKGVIELPGTIEAENFDKGGEGLTFHDSDTQDEGNARYRTDNEGVDIVACTGGYAIGYTAQGEWMEYTVDVKQAGKYKYEAVVSSGSDNSGFSLGLVEDGHVSNLTAKITVPNGGTWDVYQTLTGDVAKELKAGQQVLRITISSPYVNIDKVTLTCTEASAVDTIEADNTAEPKIYDLTGRRVTTMEAGRIYIVDGKRTVVGR